MPGKHSINPLQKTAVLGTSHIIRKVLQSETWSLSGRVHHQFKRKSTRKNLWKEEEEEEEEEEVVVVVVFIFPAPCL
jgi:hypothetical protein